MIVEFGKWLLGFKPRSDQPGDKFALVAVPLAGGSLLGVYDSRREAEDAQMEEWDPDNLEVKRVRRL